jgi:hypothetical protein
VIFNHEYIQYNCLLQIPAKNSGVKGKKAWSIREKITTVYKGHEKLNASHNSQVSIARQFKADYVTV